MRTSLAEDRPGTGRAEPEDAGATLARVEPQLRELIALARLAAALPAWSQITQARHNGPHLSSLRGRGMEYDESRPYQPGDDIRHLDWRVTARTGRPHTKLFREERERPVFLCVDYRRAMFFATRGTFKAVQAARAASLLAWHAQQNADRVGGLVFSSTMHHECAPRRGKAGAMQLVKLLVSAAPEFRTAPAAGTRDPSLAEALLRLQRVAKPGSLIFLLSDFRGFDDNCAATLIRLSAHTDLGLIVIRDPIEVEFPQLAGACAIGDDRRTVVLAAVSAEQRQHYLEQQAQRTAQVFELCREQRLLHASLATDGDAFATLIGLLGS